MTDKKAYQAEYKRQQKLIEQQYNDMILAEEKHRQEPKTAPAGTYISLRNVNKVYENYVQAVFDFNLDIQEHEFVVFVGPSGCGKSTTLRMIAGLENITTGDLFIDGVYCNDKTAKQRDIAMVFQNYALYPHMTVYENLAFGLESRKYTKEEIDRRVRRAAEILQITEYLDRRPKQLSGGQMQRVALGRAIVREAKVFLMDEPLSNLDAKLRVSMRSEIIKLHREINATTIYVTHDQTEAMTMASRIVIMNKGVVQQVGSPEEVYNHPANTFVATFIGAPAMNLLGATWCGDCVKLDGGLTIPLTAEQQKRHAEFYRTQITRVEKLIADKEYEKPDMNGLLTLHKEKPTIKSLFAKKEAYKIKTPRDRLAELEEELAHFKACLAGEHAVQLGIRPEDIYSAADTSLVENPSDKISTTIDIAELLGGDYQLHFQLAEKNVVVVCRANAHYESDQKIDFVLDLNKIHIFDAKIGTSILKQ